MKRLLSYFFPQTLFRTTSAYNQDIIVRLIDGKPALVVDHVIQSGIGFTNIWYKVFRHFHVEQLRQVKRIAVIGVGGGDVLHILRDEFPRASITAVDIDKEIIDIAKQYFGLDTMKRVAFVAQDAQDFIKKPRTYDFIILDLYIGNDIPPFLASQAFLTSAKKRLSPHGAVVVNFLKASEVASSGRFEKEANKVFSPVSTFDIAYNRFFLLRRR